MSEENKINNDHSKLGEDDLPTQKVIESTEVLNTGNGRVPNAQKENDDWEVVEASSDESFVSGSTEYDIKVPLRLIKQSPPSAEKSTQPAIQKTSEAIPNANEDIIEIPHRPILVAANSENISPPTTQSKPNVSEKEKPKHKKRKLYTGESSDEEVPPKDVGNKKQAPNEAGNRNQLVRQTTKENVNKDTVVQREVSVHPDRRNKTVVSNNANVSNNETFAIRRNKSLSDTEISEENMVALERRPMHVRKPKPNLAYISEESEDDIVEIPRSPQYSKSNGHRAYRNQSLVRQGPSHRHDCQCNCDRSSEFKRSKRQRLMLDQMWKEKERKLKLKMMKKVKDVFVKVLESIAPSDDSDFSDEESPEPPRKHTKTHCFAHPASPDDVREMKRELQYWKSKASHKEVLSPRELQMREMKAEAEYWKRVALAKDDIPTSSNAIRRTSTPVKEFEERIPARSEPSGTGNVSSSVDTAHVNPPPIANTSRDSIEEVPLPNQSRLEDATADIPNVIKSPPNPYSREKLSNRSSQALNIMSRTKFTEKEKDAIIKYLINSYDSLELIRGNMFWMQMAHDMNTHRSWHSLKNNFFQNIMKNFEVYEMPDKVRNKIISIAKNYM